MAERPAPLVLVATPPDEPMPPFGSYKAVLRDGQRQLSTELSHRLGRLGAAVAPLPSTAPTDRPFHWGIWFAAAAREALGAGAVDAIGFAASGAMALLADEDLDTLLSPIAGEVVANNRFSADAFIVAGERGQLEHALDVLEACPVDNAAPRLLATAGLSVRHLGGAPFARFDVDTPLDLALLRLATRLPERRRVDRALTAFLELVRLPGDRRLEVPNLERIGEVLRDRSAELVVAGRV